MFVVWADGSQVSEDKQLRVVHVNVHIVVSIPVSVSV